MYLVGAMKFIRTLMNAKSLLGTYDQSSWNSDERCINFIRGLCTSISRYIHTRSVKRPLDWFNGDIIYSRLLSMMKNHAIIMTWLYYDIIISMQWTIFIMRYRFSRAWKRTVLLKAVRLQSHMQRLIVEKFLFWLQIQFLHKLKFKISSYLKNLSWKLFFN